MSSATQKTGVVTLVIADDFGEVRDLDHGLVTGGIARERWTIDPDDPLSAAWHRRTGPRRCRATTGRCRTETLTAMRSDATNFHLPAASKPMRATTLVFERDFDETIPRDFI